MSKPEPQHVYFIGIGGIGMSALARYYLARGSRVSGYDLRETDLTRALSAEGADIHYEDAPERLPADVDLAVFTPAVPADFAELAALRKRGVEPIKRAEALGRISRHTKTLAVAGTHGKTTTSTMAAYLMQETGGEPVAFLGGISADYGTNYLAGRGAWMVVEADEYDRSFLHLRPDVAVVTYIEPDHLDIYGEKAAFEEGFQDFVGLINARNGVLVTKPHIARALRRSLGELRVVTYGVGEAGASGEVLDFRAEGMRVEDGAFVFDLRSVAGDFEGVRLAMPGRHNVENAVAALAATHAAGVDLGAAVARLPGFRGVGRRFEALGTWGRARVISDYAHHPTEVAAAIASARELYGSYRVVGIFQPHLFSRTRDFAEEFAAALGDLQEVVLLEIYPAREAPIPGVDSMTIFRHVTVEKKYLVHSSEAPALLEVLDGDVLLFMGAGDVDELARGLVA